MKGCKDVVYLQEGAKKLLFECYQQSKDKKKGTDKDGAKSVTEKELIIKLAAELIRNDIKALDCNKNEYFSFDELTSEQMLSYVPASLQLFLRSLVPSKNIIDNMRYAAIGQSLIQMGRPRSIMCPLQIILGTEVYHRTG